MVSCDDAEASQQGNLGRPSVLKADKKLILPGLYSVKDEKSRLTVSAGGQSRHYN